MRFVGGLRRVGFLPLEELVAVDPAVDLPPDEVAFPVGFLVDELVVIKSSSS